MMTKDLVLKIKDYVKCPQTGSLEYGKWGALRVEQRKLINDLCDSWLNMYDEKINQLEKKLRSAMLEEGVTSIYVGPIK